MISLQAIVLVAIALYLISTADGQLRDYAYDSL